MIAADGRSITFTPREIEWAQQVYGGVEELEVMQKVEAADGMYSDYADEPVHDPGD